MALAKDLIGVHDEAEQAIRYGDTGPAVVIAASVSTQGSGMVGGPTGTTLMEINPSVNAVSSVTFLTSTELDREYTIENVSGTNAMNVYPAVGGNFQGLGANVSFSIGANKVASVTRLGQIPPVSTSTLTMGTIASDRWIYVLSA